MITTRQVDIDLKDQKKNYRIATTKGIDKSLPYAKNPKPKPKQETVTTHNMEDVIKEANKRANKIARASAAAKKAGKKK